jgi:SAM-dependent methyltransferase
MNIKLTPTAKSVPGRLPRDAASLVNEVFGPYIDNLELMGNMRRRYPAPAELWDWRQMAALLGDVAGLELLDLGCSTDETSNYFAKLGARVTGSDIAGPGIANFEDASFDRIHGLGILRHVGAEFGLREAERLLRPGGIAVLGEPIGDSRTIAAMKTWFMMKARFLGTRGHVTEIGRNLTWREIELAIREFSEVTVYSYHLLHRFEQSLHRSLFETICRIDRGLLTLLPQLQHQAGGVVICLRKPALELQPPSYS